MISAFKRFTRYLIQRDPLIRYSDQFQYGHLEVIRHSLRMPTNVYLRGILQHGIYSSIGKKEYSQFRRREKLFKDAVFFAWSEHFSSLWEVQGGISEAIGSPWAHLVQENSGKSKSESGTHDVTLYFPSHSYPGWEFNPSANVLRAKRFAEKRLVTCLYWSDFINPKVKRVFDEVSDEVVCAGYRSNAPNEIPWFPTGGRNAFLYEIYSLLEASDLVLCDMIETPFWYATSLGKRTVLLGEEMHYKVGGGGENYTHTDRNFEKMQKFGIGELFSLPNLEVKDEIIEISRQLLGFHLVMEASKKLEPYIATDSRLEMISAE